MTRPCARARQANHVLTQGRPGASRGVQGRPGTNRFERLENEFAALFVWGGGENFENIVLNDINIYQKIAGFDCTFYNYLDGFEQVCSYISPVI